MTQNPGTRDQAAGGQTVTVTRPLIIIIESLARVDSHWQGPGPGSPSHQMLARSESCRWLLPAPEATDHVSGTVLTRTVTPSKLPLTGALIRPVMIMIRVMMITDHSGWPGRAACPTYRRAAAAAAVPPVPCQ